MGPSLGADSIHAGIVAGLAGLAAVIVVMLVYYKRSGVNAVLALFLNTVILMAALSYFKAVLTLPGIAGVILTIGMAVDSNVLIFERIREELRAGKAIVSAVDAGFSKGLVDDRRYPRHHGGFLRFPVHFRGRAGAGLCRDLDHRPDRQRLHGGVCVEGDFRLRVVRAPATGGVEHYETSAAGAEARCRTDGNNFEKSGVEVMLSTGMA